MLPTPFEMLELKRYILQLLFAKVHNEVQCGAISRVHEIGMGFCEMLVKVSFAFIKVEISS